MKPKLQPNLNRFILLFALSAVIGITLVVLAFPFTSGSLGAFWEKVFTVIILWASYTFVTFLAIRFIIGLFHIRKQIYDILRKPYSWSVSLIVEILSALPFLFNALINWTKGGIEYLKFYAIFCFVPILVIGFVASLKLLPRLNFLVIIKLLFGGVFIWIAVIIFFHGFYAIFFEPYIFFFPTKEEFLSFSLYFWVAFIIIWLIWSTKIRISEQLPSRIRRLFETVKTYRPDLDFIFNSIILFLIYPITVVFMEIFYNQVLSTFGVLLNFSQLDKTTWRFSLSLIPIVLSIFFLLFLGFATLKIISQPILVKKITVSPSVSGFVAILWLFILWWIFFSSITTLLYFLFPGEFLFLNYTFQLSYFHDFFDYAFNVMTSNDPGYIKAIGEVAHWVRYWMTLTGYLLLITLGVVITTTFVNRLFRDNDQ